MTAAHLNTSPIEYREIERLPGFRFGNDGSAWTRRMRGGNLRDEWRQLKPQRLLSGHYRIITYVEKQSKSEYIHRLILEAFVGPCPPGMECCHYDGDPANNRPENLRWDTSKNNHADRIRHGRTGRGKRRGKMILHESDVREIRRLLAEGMTSRPLAAKFGVNKSTIGHINTGRSWSSLV